MNYYSQISPQWQSLFRSDNDDEHDSAGISKNFTIRWALVIKLEATIDQKTGYILLATGNGKKNNKRKRATHQDII